jgi:DNA helicase-2/ATP-dependent DNA helicase PcrA
MSHDQQLLTLKLEILGGKMSSHTDEQIAILSAAHASGNIMLTAYAGCGKTSTLEMIDKQARERPCLYLVFNKRNADEATERMLSTTTVRTFNALGHRIWQDSITTRLKVEPRKTYNIYKDIADEVKGEAAKAIWDAYDEVRRGVEFAKAYGYVPEGAYPNATRLILRGAFHSRLDEEPDDLVSDLIDTVLKRSIKLSYEGVIDYNDQIYMSSLFGGTYPKYPLTLVDEYQDLSPVNHEMIRRLVGNRRLIGVGDPHQNIYGFRGAKSNGMAEAVSAYSMKEMDLSISFRCPEAIVRNAWWHVPKFKWSKTGGHVEQLSHLVANSIDDTAVIICRNNAPIFSLALKLIGSGHSVRIVGSDIGPRLVKTMEKLGESSMSQAQVLWAIDEWLQLKLAKESKTALDTAECMRVFARTGNTLAQAIAYAEHLFKQQGTIQLMTGHKSKGLEFPLVYHLDPQIIGDGPQDKNLRYVIQTRSSDQYYEIESEAVEW